MENKKISYYELLGMIKEGNIPKKLYVKLPQVNYGSTYIAEYDDEDFSYYCQEDTKDNEVNYRSYLGECFLESDMFAECIEILEDEEEFEDIEELEFDADFGGDFLINDEGNKCKIASHDKTIINRLNKVIKNQKKIIERLENERY